MKQESLVVLPLVAAVLIGCGQSREAEPQATAADPAPQVVRSEPPAAGPYAWDQPTTAEAAPSRHPWAQPEADGGANPVQTAAYVAEEPLRPDLPPADTPPETVVEAFLKALREGSQRQVAGLLTDKARDEAARHDLVIEPQGLPSAHFEVGRVERNGPTGAYVSSRWSEPDGRGGHESYEITWVVRRQDNGWRVAGMATEVVRGEPPWFLNFEDPADLIGKKQQAEAVLAAQPDAAPNR